MWRQFAWAIVASWTVIAVGFAQTEPTPPGTPPQPISRPSWTVLIDRAAQQELKLTEEQVRQVKQLAEEQATLAKEALSKLEGLSLDERRQKAREQGPASLERGRLAEERVQQILTEAQRERLAQIKLRMDGEMAIIRPDVSERLQLSAEQRRQIRALFGVSLEERMRARAPLKPDATPAEREAWLAELRENSTKRVEQTNQRNADILAVLTDEQRSQWNAMLGPESALRGGVLAPPEATPRPPRNLALPEREPPKLDAGFLDLLRLPAVQEELRLNAEQQQQIDEAIAATQELRRPPPLPRLAFDPTLNPTAQRERIEEDRRKLAEHQASFQEYLAQQNAASNKLDELVRTRFDGPQIARLRELRLQKLGDDALTSPDFAEQLELSRVQRDELVRIEEKYRSPLEETAAGGKRLDFQSRLTQIRERRQHRNAEMKAVLTQDQHAKWQDLLGTPFTFPATNAVVPPVAGK